MNRKIVIFSGTLALIGIIWLSGQAPREEANAMNYNPLSLEERRVILREGTEGAFTGKYNDHHETGIYTCKQCDRPLFESVSKFDSGTGWPSFDDAIAGAIREVPDGRRTEIECARKDVFPLRNPHH